MIITRISELYPDFWQVWIRSEGCICSVSVSGQREVAEMAEQIICDHLQAMRHDIDQHQRRYQQCSAHDVDTTEVACFQAKTKDANGSGAGSA